MGILFSVAHPCIELSRTVLPSVVEGRISQLITLTCHVSSYCHFMRQLPAQENKFSVQVSTPVFVVAKTCNIDCFDKANLVVNSSNL